jgi:hypothetical protein
MRCSWQEHGDGDIQASLSPHHDTSYPNAGLRATRFNVCLAELSLALVQSFLALLLFLYLYDFYMGSQLKDVLSLRGGDYELGLLNNVGTVKTMETNGDRLCPFCIMR